MIKRLVGILFTLLTLAVVAWTIYNRGNYRSFRSETVSQPASVEVEVDAEPSLPDAVDEQQ
jgi:hypothetical protein